MEGSILSYNPETLENWIYFRDVQMILVPCFEIPNGYRVVKNVRKLRVQVIPSSTTWKALFNPATLLKYVFDIKIPPFFFAQRDLLILNQLTLYLGMERQYSRKLELGIVVS